MNNSAIHSLLDIALSTPRETADVFFSFSPNCHIIDIRIHPGGWREGEYPDFSRTAVTNAGDDVDLLLVATQHYISNIDEAKRKAARERLEKARAELLSAEYDYGRSKAMERSEIISRAPERSGWTPESGEPCPMEELHTFSVPEREATTAEREAYDRTVGDDTTSPLWLDSQEAEDHKPRSCPI